MSQIRFFISSFHVTTSFSHILVLKHVLKFRCLESDMSSIAFNYSSLCYATLSLGCQFIRLNKSLLLAQRKLVQPIVHCNIFSPNKFLYGLGAWHVTQAMCFKRNFCIQWKLRPFSQIHQRLIPVLEDAGGNSPRLKILSQF